MSCSIGRRRGSDPALLWLWCRLAAIAPIRPLAWEPPYAAGAAQEKIEKKKNRMNSLDQEWEDYLLLLFLILIYLPTYLFILSF